MSNSTVKDEVSPSSIVILLLLPSMFGPAVITTLAVSSSVNSTPTFPEGKKLLYLGSVEETDGSSSMPVILPSSIRL